MNIPAIASNGLDLAWSVAATALTAVVVYSAPTFAYDGATDVTTPTWGSTITGKKALLYEEKEISKENAVTFPGCSHQAMALIRKKDFAVAPTSASEVDAGAAPVRWRVGDVETLPADAGYILTLVR